MRSAWRGGAKEELGEEEEDPVDVQNLGNRENRDIPYRTLNFYLHSLLCVELFFLNSYVES